MNALKPNFEAFVPEGKRTQPLLSINKDGKMTVNREARNRLGDPSYVELLFDPEQRIIGLRPATRETSNRYSINRANGTIGAGAFAIHYGIRAARNMNAIVEDGILVAALPDEEVTP